MLAEIKRWHDPSILRSNESSQVRVVVGKLCYAWQQFSTPQITDLNLLTVIPNFCLTVPRFTCPSICHLLIPGIVKLSSTLWSCRGKSAPKNIRKTSLWKHSRKIVTMQNPLRFTIIIVIHAMKPPSLQRHSQTSLPDYLSNERSKSFHEGPQAETSSDASSSALNFCLLEHFKPNTIVMVAEDGQPNFTTQRSGIDPIECLPNFLIRQVYTSGFVWPKVGSQLCQCHFPCHKFQDAESKGDVSTSPALVNCTFVASLIWSMGKPQPVFIPSQRYQRFGYVEWWDTEAARPVGRSCLPHSRSTEHQSCVLNAKRKGRPAFSVYKISSYLLNVFHNVVIPLHSAADPKDPRQSLRRASSFAPQRPLEPCHQPLAHSHRPWEAKALKIHHPSMHPSTRKNALKVIQHCSTLRAPFCTLTWLQLTASPVSLKHCFMSLMLQADLSISDSPIGIV